MADPDPSSSAPALPEGLDRFDRFWSPDGPLARVLSGFEQRPQQIVMARAVAHALEEGRTLLVEAGTGTGKTLAYLVPAVFSGKKVIVSTGTKALQDQLAGHDLPIIAAALDRTLDWCVMKGRDNYLCLYRHDQMGEQTGFLDGRRVPLDLVARWRETTETGDRAELTWLADDDPLWKSLSVTAEQCLGTACPQFEPCFLTRLKRRAARADVVIVNHALFFADLALGRHASGAILPHHTAVIFDEAHGLEDVAANHWGVTVSRFRLVDLIADLGREPIAAGGLPAETAWRRLLDDLRVASDRAFDALRAFHGPGVAGRGRWSPDASDAGAAAGLDLLDRLSAVGAQAREQAVHGPGWERLAERVGAMAVDVRFLWRAEDPAYVFWVESSGVNLRITASPLDVSGLLRDALFGRETVCVLTSATLATGGSYDYLRARLGIDHADEVLLQSPFDYATQTLLYIPVHLPRPRDPEFPRAASDEILRIVAASGGRAFLLFTSRRMLDLAYALCASRLECAVFKQGDAPRMALIQQFKAQTPSVLFATMGFWQGIDIEGEALSCVVLDKLPFAPPDDPLIQARLDALRRRGEDPFTAYQLPSAAMWLKQGMGRLIRSRRDRGAICVLDVRLLASRYGAYFLESLPPSPVTTRYEDLVKFFAAEPRAGVLAGEPLRRAPVT